MFFAGISDYSVCSRGYYAVAHDKANHSVQSAGWFGTRSALNPVFLTSYFASDVTVHIKHLMTGLKGKQIALFLENLDTKMGKLKDIERIHVQRRSSLDIRHRHSSITILQSRDTNNMLKKLSVFRR